MSLPPLSAWILGVGIPVYAILFVLVMFVMWRRYIKVGRQRSCQNDTDDYGLTEEFGPDFLMNCPQQQGATLLHDIFERSARKFPNTIAVRVAGSVVETGRTGMPASDLQDIVVAPDQSQQADVEHILGLASDAAPLQYQSSVTYRELSQLSSRIADVLLQGSTVQHPPPYVSSPDDIVAVLVPRICVHPFVAQLGALKAGAGVLMLDANLPDSVLKYQIGDSKPKALLTLNCYIQERARQNQMDFEEYCEDLLSGEEISMIDLDMLFRAEITPNRWNAPHKQQVLSLLRPSNLAMVIYTSGSTGKPKAVLVEHAGYVNYALDYCNYMNLVPNYDVHGQMASLSFDASLEELYGAWCSGIPLVVFTDAQIRSGPDLAPLLCAEGITAVSLVPSLLSTISRNPEKDFPYPLLRYITVGGEAITESLVEPWTRGRRELINSYGPTEATIVVCRQSLRAGKGVTIGTPVANISLFCIDHEALEGAPAGTPLRVLPHGQAGELCCAGVQLARGYLNRPELTAEKFVEQSGTSYGRTYRTGDLCYIDSETKQIVYQGRIDQQVKIRGNRIELGAVEHALAAELKNVLDREDRPDEAGADDGAVEHRDDPVAAKQGEILVAFLPVPRRFTGKADTVEVLSPELQSECRAALAKALPPAAVPSALFFVPRLARQIAAGKIDRKALPKVLDLLGSGAGTAAAQGEDEMQSLEQGDESMQELLRSPAVARCLCACRDILPGLNFGDEFAKAGADSIKIAQLAGILREFVPTVSVKDIVHYRSLQALWLGLAVKTSDESCGKNAADADAHREKLSGIRYAKDCIILHPYIFTFAQCCMIGTAGIFTLVVTVVNTVVALDFWDWFYPYLPLEVEDNLILFFVVMAPVLTISFVVFQLAVALLILLPYYRFVLCGCVTKCLLRIKLTPGIKYPKWSGVHLYLWLRMQYETHLIDGLMYFTTVAGSDGLRSFFLRFLGATIGKDVVFDTDTDFSHVLAEFLSIGDKCIFEAESQLSTCTMGQDFIMVAPLVIESNVKAGSRSYLGLGAHIKEGCFVDHMAAIDDFYVSPNAWEILSGVPATATGIAVAPLPTCHSKASKVNRWSEKPLPACVQNSIEMVVLLGIVWFLEATAIGVGWLTWPFNDWNEFHLFFNQYEGAPPIPREGAHFLNAFFGEGEYEYLGLQPRSPAEMLFVRVLPIAVYFAFVWTITFYLELVLFSYGILRNPLLRVGVGSYPRRSLIASLARAKRALFDSFQTEMFGFNSKAYMMRASGVTFENSCACSELATCKGLLPEASLVGANSFWADDCRCVQLDYEGECIKVQRGRFPQNFFMGNHAMIEPASHPTNYLVGVATVAYGHTARRQMQTRLDGSVTIFGNPPMVISSDRSARFALDKVAAEDSKEVPDNSVDDPAPQQADYTDEFAFEPTFKEFAYRGMLFDGLFTFAKILPNALLLAIFAFWIVNDFGPTRTSIVIHGNGLHEGLHMKGLQTYDDFWQAKQDEMTHEQFDLWWYDRAVSLNISTFPLNSSFYNETVLETRMMRQTRDGHSFVATRELFHSWDLLASHIRLAIYLFLWSIFVPYSFLALKWLLVHRMPKGSHSLFGSRVQRHFFTWMLSESWMAPFMKKWEGTLVLNYFFRFLGSKIGSRTLLLQGYAGSSGDVDMWEIGSDCVIDGNPWQSHTFEDRVFWNWTSSIGDRCYVGPQISLMGGARVEDDVNLGAASVVWKMQELAGGTPGCPLSYHGNPPVEVESAPSAAKSTDVADPYNSIELQDVPVARQAMAPPSATLLETA